MRPFAAIVLVFSLVLPSSSFASETSSVGSASSASEAGTAETGATTGLLVGYSPRSNQSERDWEAKFRAIPDPANLREYMRRLSARPHHVGSPYDKENAEWILARFKEWG